MLVAFTGMLQVKGVPQGTDTRTYPILPNDVGNQIFWTNVGEIADRLMATLGTNLEQIEKTPIWKRADNIRESIVYTLTALSRYNGPLCEQVVWCVAIQGFHQATFSQIMPYSAFVGVVMLAPFAGKQQLRPNAVYQATCSSIFDMFFEKWHASLSPHRNNNFVDSIWQIAGSLKSGTGNDIRVGVTEELAALTDNVINTLVRNDSWNGTPFAELYAWQVVAYLLTHPTWNSSIPTRSDVINKTLKTISDFSNNHKGDH